MIVLKFYQVCLDTGNDDVTILRRQYKKFKKPSNLKILTWNFSGN